MFKKDILYFFTIIFVLNINGMGLSKNGNEEKNKADSAAIATEMVYSRTLAQDSSMIKYIIENRLRNKMNLDLQIHTDTVNSFGAPLHTTATYDKIWQAEKLLAAGANPNVVIGYMPSPLYEAIDLASIRVMRALLYAKANPNYKLPYSPNTTVLQRACQRAVQMSHCGEYRESYIKKYVKVVKLLLSFGADPNAQDIHGHTPLFEVLEVHPRSLSLVPLLLKSGADITIKNKKGQDVMEYAKANRLLDAVGTRRLKEAVAESHK